MARICNTTLNAEFGKWLKEYIAPYGEIAQAQPVGAEKGGARHRASGRALGKSRAR